ncbi:MAG: hypothetical protein IPL43_10425 [Micropruina sp.]|nr:hypothetical protein [Micropruina sp.]
MATDVARLSYDPARYYRGVVPQMGRAGLEAETNEQRTIDTEESRAQIIDIVGPVGTPDNGYAVSQGTGQNLVIGAGTMYVGGWRVELASELNDSSQPDWLDQPPEQDRPRREHVVLLVWETDVTAVEDPALYEVALGGPDTSARTRLLQRIVRLDTEGATCAAALAQDVKRWAAQGVRFDPETAALESNSRLLVTWEGDPAPINPCEPTSLGGYLGAENQLIRVQLTRVGQDGRFDLIWGYDDASFLYRVSADASANPVLTLDRSPVDDYHRPRAGQAVQALRATAALQSTDEQVEGHVGALGGVVGVLAVPYDPDLKTVQFPAPLPPAYTDQDSNPQLFLRVWEEQLTDLEVGQPIRLTGTGMQVTITAEDVGGLQVDDFWCVGVRPATPTAVYPSRYLRTPQPPDGPRRWVCPLAVIEWRDRELDILEDCRRPFRPLTELDDDGCCTIEVRPSHAANGSLQARIDRAVAGRTPKERGDRVMVCFAPGRYELSRPLILGKRHSNLTLRSCNEAAVLTVREGAETEFGHGLVIAVDADNLTISGLEFELPQVPATLARVSGTTGGVFDREAVRAINVEQANRYVSIGVRAINCAVLAVSDCLFRFTVGERQTTREDAQTMPRNVFGVGVFAGGGAWGFQLRDNRFLHDATVPIADDGPYHLLVGYLLTQTAIGRSTEATHSLGVARLPGLLDDALICGNEFRGLTAAIFVAAELGDVRVWDNVVSQCFGGLWLIDAAALLGAEGSNQRLAAGSGTLAASGFATNEGVLLRLLVIAMLYPLPNLKKPVTRGVVTASGTVLANLRETAVLREREVTEVVLSRVAAATAAGAATATATAGATVTAAPVGQPNVAAAPVGQPNIATPPVGQPNVAAAPVGEPNVADAPEVSPNLTAGAAVSDNLAAAWRGLAALNRLVDRRMDLPCALGIQRNTVDCHTPEEGSTGPAVLIGTPVTQELRPTVSLVGNRLVSPRATIVAAVSGASAATVTGNIIAGMGEQPLALVVVATQTAAITGNVIIGRTALPANRPFPPPFDTWLPFNEISL